MSQAEKKTPVPRCLNLEQLEVALREQLAVEESMTPAERAELYEHLNAEDTRDVCARVSEKRAMAERALAESKDVSLNESLLLEPDYDAALSGKLNCRERQTLQMALDEYHESNVRKALAGDASALRGLLWASEVIGSFFEPTEYHLYQTKPVVGRITSDPGNKKKRENAAGRTELLDNFLLENENDWRGEMKHGTIKRLRNAFLKVHASTVLELTKNDGQMSKDWPSRQTIERRIKSLRSR